VPWKHIKDHAADFIRPGHLPEAVLMNAGDQAAQLEDPSDMRKEQIVRLLEHWRRPVSASDLFRFTHVLVNGKGGEVEPALYTNSLGPQSFPHNAPLPATSGSETRDETGSGGEILPTAYENVHEPQSFSQDTSWLATDGAVTRDEHCRNANTLTEHDPGLPAGPEVDASLGQEERHSPQQDLGPAGALDVTTPTTSLEAGPSPLTFDNRPLGAGRPRPKPKPKGRQNNVQPEPPATDLNPDGVGGEVEGVLGRPRRQPKTRKLDACLTMQFEAVEKEQERERAKLNKVREEKRAKRDAQVGWPAKRQRTSLK
jgi:hypothetical protein